ncbi:receptor for retinol uptake STRA6 isoform X1 [Malaclemys terrapin pileata]|uniref:receptor for retinol uptake STRA6 isoform X1 n=2 Tax=Malaclemys terrapin pileata TaxID=2991368 RepID=UPI0023A90C82|nr:receptor for retinol uptake STRA6 isoform X1 [Malaclemys terrapin pileata]XP_053896958.1 receptor for retinol uptake STRA6 isoform X1 [Malaclemys terrapin pileata]XP_053896959.1 receptor for retinol uptake STRA6 isoform X1 [Malaclemys terrapin pileata]
MANDSSLAVHGSLAYDDFASSDWYMYESMEPETPQDDMLPNVILACDPTIPYRLYHTCMAPISLAVLIVLSLLVKRKSLYKSSWNGAPGLLSPVNFLEAEGHQGLVAAVFGILFSSICVLVLDTDPLPFIASSSPRSREYWKIMALLYYPAFYYPLIACATIRHRAGYFVGCLLSWCHCLVHIWQKVDCPQSPKIYRYYSLLSYVPIILCLVVLSIWYPVLLVRSFTQEKPDAREEDTGGTSSLSVGSAGSNRSIGDRLIASSEDTIKSIPDGSAVDSGNPPRQEAEAESTAAWQRSTRCRPHSQVVGSGYYNEYLKTILAKRTHKRSSRKVSLLSRAQMYLRSYIYTPQEGFQVPLKLVLSVTTAVIAVYQVALLLLVVFIPNIQIVRAGMTKEITVLLVQFGVVPSENPGGVPGDMERELDTVRYYLWSLEVCYVCSLVLSCLLTFSMLMRSLVMHRANLKALYRGDVLDVFYRAQMLCPSQQALVCWMSFASFQTAFACLGLLTQQVIFFVCTVGFTFLVVIPLQSGTNMHLFKILENMWPFWLTLVLAVVVQNLLAHFHFLEKHHLQKELTNRRALCIMTYLLFPINVLVGVLAGVWRMVISALYNAVHFCQLDISLLNRGVEAFDPGYRTYCHYLKIEVSQSHPVMKAFCFLLLQLCGPEGQTGLKPTDVEEGIQLMQPVKGLLKASKSKQTRARWGLAYTLLNNPSLLACRKTVLSDPTANGTQYCPAKP